MTFAATSAWHPKQMRLYRYNNFEYAKNYDSAKGSDYGKDEAKGKFKGEKGKGSSWWSSGGDWHSRGQDNYQQQNHQQHTIPTKSTQLSTRARVLLRVRRVWRLQWPALP